MGTPKLAPRRSREVDHTTAISQLLADLRGGRREAFDQIVALVYYALRRAARRELASRSSDTLSATALVHELYLELSRTHHVDWRNRPHFLCLRVAAQPAGIRGHR